MKDKPNQALQAKLEQDFDFNQRGDLEESKQKKMEQTAASEETK